MIYCNKMCYNTANCRAVCSAERLRPLTSYLVTDVQSEDDGQHAGRRVATVTLGPAIANILKEHRVHHQNLHTDRVLPW